MPCVSCAPQGKRGSLKDLSSDGEEEDSEQDSDFSAEDAGGKGGAARRRASTAEVSDDDSDLELLEADEVNRRYSLQVRGLRRYLVCFCLFPGPCAEQGDRPGVR